MVDLKKFKGIFISEVEDQLEILNKNFLSVEKEVQNKGAENVDVKLFDNLMRASHTIKGSSASMGFNKTAFLAHVMEDIFDGARSQGLVLNQKIFNQVFKAIDGIEKTVISIKEKEVEADTSEIAKKLKAISGVSTEGVGKSERQQKADKENKPIEDKQKKSNTKDENQISKKNKDDDEDEIERARSKIDYIKVPVKRLDALLDLVEELLVDKMRLSEIGQKNIELKEVVDHFNLLISGIQHEVMQSRLVPVEQAFARFPRMIRDLAEKQKKKINFQISGGEIELDRTVVDKLGEPLIHLLRNAVDHGISSKGEINLRAIRKSERVVFEVENSGGGVDIEKIKEVAIRRGVVDSKGLQEMADKELLDLIFHPNFSTSDKVTEISGRGVGLSVVKKFVEAFGGKVRVENFEDSVKFVLELPLTLAIIETLLVKVSDVYFAIPFANIERSVSVPHEDIKKMTDYDMAVIDGINVPLVSLEEVFRLRNDMNIEDLKINDVSNSPQLEDKNIKEEKELKQESKGEAKNNKKNVIAVLVKRDQEVVGIVVDGLVSEQEVIVKPFSPVLRNIKGFSGSTILGDGSVVLILDVINLLKYFSRV